MFEFNSNHSNDSGVNNMYPGILLINIIVLFISEPYAAPSTTINVTSEFDFENCKLFLQLFLKYFYTYTIHKNQSIEAYFLCF